MRHAREDLHIEWSGGMVTGRLEGSGSTGILLAHGAGAGQDHPWMAAMRSNLATHGLQVLTFDYDYIERGRKRPDPAGRLLDVHGAAADVLARRCAKVVLGGKSMGGRMASHLAASGWPAAALVYLGYPLVPIGKSEARDTSHLRSITVGQLFVGGTRDRLGPVDMIRSVAASVPDGTLLVVDDGDHSLRVPKRSERTSEEVLSEVATAVAAWIADRTSGPDGLSRPRDTFRA